MNGLSRSRCPSCGELLVEEPFGQRPQCYNDRCSDGGDTLEAQRQGLSARHKGSGCGCLVINLILHFLLIVLAVRLIMFFGCDS